MCAIFWTTELTVDTNEMHVVGQCCMPTMMDRYEVLMTLHLRQYYIYNIVLDV